ncbi:MAG: NAD-dependent epimerase/dehydratase family protein [Chlorobi bacterium]|nr:NAD-dependent epimerase/dehydratase family protein [Chlorobiota bacterium]
MIENLNGFESTDQLDHFLSTPTPELVRLFSKLEGDLLFLGIGGKIGRSMARMAKRACKEAGVQKRIIGVDRFASEEQKKKLENEHFEIIKGDLLDQSFIRSLPDVKNVIFLAGMKFGSEENLSLTWAINSYLPAMVAERYKNSRIVAFSTGCVYELVPVRSGGSLETDHPAPVGEYAQSCLGRERMFEYGSRKNKTPVALIRLNYAIEMRYGVLVDIANKVKNRIPVDLSMGYFNVIWQGDVNSMGLRALDYCETPARILNITGAETLSVRKIAEQFGKLFNCEPEFTGKEAKTALLSNASLSHKLFGDPEIPVEKMIEWIADWLIHDNPTYNKPTHFEVRNGKY